MANQSEQCARLAAARDQYRRCLLCEHRCGVNRLAGEVGRCGAGATARVHRYRVEYGEELELVPSCLFYLSGCDLRCVFCVGEQDAIDPSRGQALTVDLFQSGLQAGLAQGARTIQWVGGEPTIHLPAVFQAMSQCSQLPTVVWKSNFHATPEAMALLAGVVDVYVADFKFGNDRCAKQLAGIDDYFRIVTRNLMLAAQAGRLIVRHLLLPEHLDCCYRPILQWLKTSLPGVALSLRDSYLPSWHAAEYGALGQTIGRRAARHARAMAEEMGLQVIQ
ncbi:MAG TPA: radical SAM protein [Tepidisphaeraceae bacterium]|nr:radical SAM protein [Tepidisphaeraceae bacterium]